VKKGKKEIVLVGTYRPENENWIAEKRLYNLPLPKCGKLDFHDRVSGVVLFAEGHRIFAFVTKLREVVDGTWLKENGYSVARQSHGTRYALYELTDESTPAKLLGRTSAEVFVSSSRCPSVKIDESFYAKPYPVTGGSSMPFVFDSIKPYFRKWKSATTFDPVQEDFLRLLDYAFASEPVGRLMLPDSVKSVFSNSDGTLFQGDSLLWLKGLPDSCVDMAFADPPYSICKADWDCFKSHEEYLSWCEKWIFEISRVLKKDGTCYICGFSEILADVKYRTQKYFDGCRWIVWHYKNKANLGFDWGRSHESILHFRKSKTTRLNVDDIRIPYNAHTLKYPSHPQSETSAYGNGKPCQLASWKPNERGAKPKDVFDIPTTCNGMGEKTPHPTQKPEELLRKLILASSDPGELVIDPFSGSGTTAVVAQQLHRRWMVCDMNGEYNLWAQKRITAVADHPVEYWIDMDREVNKRRESIR